MNIIRLLIMGLLVAGCGGLAEKSAPQPPAVFITLSNPALHNANGTWMLNKQIFSGYILEKEGNSILSKLPIVSGKEHGTALGWYKNGRKRYERGFLSGNREGMHRGWYENGTVSFVYQFHNDNYEGEQQTFYESGQRWQCLHYVKGYEEGKQKTWNDNGRVVNNFTVKHGKLYGVIGRYDCMSVVKK